ncbi:MAG: hypothetical protein ABIR98_02505 [Usitatibacter sp.]
MKTIVIALALGVAGTPKGEAAEAKTPALELKPKAALVVPAQQSRYAPFTAPSGEHELELAPRRDARQDASRSSCSGERALCYDPASGRIVYKPARAFMPELPGLQAENISLKRDRVVLRYSFY